MAGRVILRSKGAIKASMILELRTASGMLQRNSPQYSSFVGPNSTDASLQTELREEKRYKGHHMLAPFTAGWQRTSLNPLVIEKLEDMIGSKS